MHASEPAGCTFPNQFGALFLSRLKAKSIWVDQFADAVVEAVHHAVGLRLAEWTQAVLNAHRFAAYIELVPSGRFTLLAGEPVSELADVIGQQFADFHRRCAFHVIQEVHAACFAVVGVNAQELRHDSLLPESHAVRLHGGRWTDQPGAIA